MLLLCTYKDIRAATDIFSSCKILLTDLTGQEIEGIMYVMVVYINLFLNKLMTTAAFGEASSLKAKKL